MTVVIKPAASGLLAGHANLCALSHCTQPWNVYECVAKDKYQYTQTSKYFTAISA